METATATDLAPITTTTTLGVPERRHGGGRPALALMGAGLAALALAAMTLIPASEDPNGAGPAPVAAPATVAGGLTIHGPGDITVLTMTYEAGQSSGWHAHHGIHAVAILSGALAVYDASCNRTTYGPDNPYIGGQQLHLINNETDAAVSMIVTYLNPVQPSAPARITTTTPACATS